MVYVTVYHLVIIWFVDNLHVVQVQYGVHALYSTCSMGICFMECR